VSPSDLPNLKMDDSGGGEESRDNVKNDN